MEFFSFVAAGARRALETGMAFFGLYGSMAALATTLILNDVVNCVGIGFQRGTHTRWQLVDNDASGSPTLTDMGASFASPPVGC